MAASPGSFSSVSAHRGIPARSSATAASATARKPPARTARKSHLTECNTPGDKGQRKGKSKAAPGKAPVAVAFTRSGQPVSSVRFHSKVPTRYDQNGRKVPAISMPGIEDLFGPDLQLTGAHTKEGGQIARTANGSTFAVTTKTQITSVSQQELARLRFQANPSLPRCSRSLTKEQRAANEQRETQYVYDKNGKKLFGYR